MLMRALNAPGSLEIVLGALIFIVGLSADLLSPNWAVPMFAVLRDVYASLGLFAVLLAAFGEAIPIVSIYLPFSFVTVLALLSVDFSFASILPLWISANIGYSLGLVVSYLMGCAFAVRRDASPKFEPSRFLLAGLFVAAASPNLNALFVMQLGSAGAPVRLVGVACLAAALWSAFWFAIIPLAGSAASNAVGAERTYMVLAAVLVVMGIIKMMRAQRP
jgi:hypothetical protein